MAAAYGLLDTERNVLVCVDAITDTYDIGNFHSPFLTPETEAFGKPLPVFRTESLADAAAVTVTDAGGDRAIFSRGRLPGLGTYSRGRLQPVILTPDGGWKPVDGPGYTLTDLFSALDKGELPKRRIEAMVHAMVGAAPGEILTPMPYRSAISDEQWGVFKVVDPRRQTGPGSVPFGDMVIADFPKCLSSIDDAFSWAVGLGLNASDLLAAAARSEHGNSPKKLAARIVYWGVNAWERRNTDPIPTLLELPAKQGYPIEVWVAGEREDCFRNLDNAKDFFATCKGYPAAIYVVENGRRVFLSN